MQFIIWKTAPLPEIWKYFKQNISCQKLTGAVNFLLTPSMNIERDSSKVGYLRITWHCSKWWAGKSHAKRSWKPQNTYLNGLKSRMRYMENFCKVAMHLNARGKHRISWKDEFKLKVHILSFFSNQKFLKMWYTSFFKRMCRARTSLHFCSPIKNQELSVTTCSSGNYIPTPACTGIRPVSPSLQIPLPLPPTIHTPSVPGNFCFNLKKSIYKIPSMHSTTIFP